MVFDLDGTLTRHDTFLPFVGGLLLRTPQRWWRTPGLLWLFVQYGMRRLDRGELKGAVLHLLFRGLPRTRIEAWAQAHAGNVLRGGMHAEGLAAWRAHKDAGDELVLLSASPDLYVPLIGAALGADQTLCTPILWEGEHLDGRLAGPNHRGVVKTLVLEGLASHRLGMKTVAYGNSPPDLDHMLRCDEAIYVNGSELPASASGIQRVRWH